MGKDQVMTAGAAVKRFMPEDQHSDRVYVCLGPDWGRHPCSLAHLAGAIAHKAPLIWVNSIGQRSARLRSRDLLRLWQKGRRALFGAGEGPRYPQGPQAVIDPRILPLHYHAGLRRWNANRLARQLRPALSDWLNKDIVFITSNPVAVDVIEAIKPALSVYYCMDEYAAMSDSDPDLIRLCEPMMIRTVDLAFATSLHLCETKSRFGKDVHYLPQAVDFGHFQQQKSCPAPLTALPRPLLGFHGILGDRVDLGLFEKILRCFPHASLVAIGNAEADISRLSRYANFHHFPAVAYSELPAWSAQFDIGLIAYVHNDHLAGVNPLKLLEYLALGLPVVATHVPELERHAQQVEISRTHSQYLAKLRKLIQRYPFSEGERDIRKAYAKHQSWEARAQQLIDACDVRLKDREGRADAQGGRACARC